MKQQIITHVSKRWLPALIILVSACGSGEALGPPPDINRAWELVSGSHQGLTIEPSESHPITVQFDGDLVTGTAACNGFGGSYQLDGTAITLDELSITEMACQPVSVMELERQFMSALAAVGEIAAEDDLLKLAGPDVELLFRPLPPPPTTELLGTVWLLDGVISNDSVASVSGDRATLELFSDGSFIGSTGCRTFTGSYATNGTGFAVSDLAAQGDCPSALIEQDNSVISVLEGSFRVVLEETRLTLTSDAQEGLIYVADPDSA